MRSEANQRKRHFLFATVGRWWWSVALSGYLFMPLPAVASNAGNQATISKFALNAYCSEARSQSTLLREGTVSYKEVADMASERALTEYPNVYHDPSAWKAKIVAVLDQYGDEPTAELCGENPGPRS
jgi:hypothetical protein